MTNRPEQRLSLEIPNISEKTSIKILQDWSHQRWPSDAKMHVAADMVKNCQELLAKKNIDWKLVLRNIRIENFGLQFGESAIANSEAHIVGPLAAQVDWPMHRPEIVYLSGKCIASRVSEKLEDFKKTMLETAIVYGQKTIPNANLCMEVLDYILEIPNRNKERHTIKQLYALLREGNTEGAYKTMQSRRDFVSKRR